MHECKDLFCQKLLHKESYKTLEKILLSGM